MPSAAATQDVGVGRGIGDQESLAVCRSRIVVTPGPFCGAGEVDQEIGTRQIGPTGIVEPKCTVEPVGGVRVHCAGRRPPRRDDTPAGTIDTVAAVDHVFRDLRSSTLPHQRDEHRRGTSVELASLTATDVGDGRIADQGVRESAAAIAD